MPLPGANFQPLALCCEEVEDHIQDGNHKECGNESCAKYHQGIETCSMAPGGTTILLLALPLS